MARGRGFARMRSYSMDGSYNRINPNKDLYSIGELHAAEVPSSTFGYERVSKTSISRRSSFSWGRRSSKKYFDTDGLEDSATRATQAAASKVTLETPQVPKKPKKKSGIKDFFNGILDSYKKIMQSAEEVDMQLSDLYPGNPMVAPVTPAASTRASSIFHLLQALAARPLFVLQRNLLVKDSKVHVDGGDVHQLNI